MFFILDRDGVINIESEQFIKSPDEWIPIPGSLKAIAQLTQAEHRVVIASNQSGVGRGLFSEKTLADIHQKMLHAIFAAGGKIEKIYYCPHRPEDQCVCRKPKPGMIDAIVRDFNLQSKCIVVIGDRLRDLQAASHVASQFVLIQTGDGKEILQQWSNKIEPLVFKNLLAAANYFISKQ